MTSAERSRRYRKRHPEKVRKSRRAAQCRKSESRELSNHLCECGCGEYTYLAVGTSSGTGIKKGEPLRYRQGHNAIGRGVGARKPVRYLEEDRGYTTPCWIWQLKIDKHGYGHEGDGSAHRRYYERLVGAIPQGYQVDHRCLQRSCVNPDHLVACTSQQNLWRMFMHKAGLTAQQIDSLAEWAEANLTPEQIQTVWNVD